MSRGNNHESFLQMIGLTDPGVQSPKIPEPDPEAGFETEPAFIAEEVPELEGSNGSASATEWELEEAKLENELSAIELTKTEQIPHRLSSFRETTSIYSNAEARSIVDKNEAQNEPSASGTILLSRSIQTAALPAEPEVKPEERSRPTQGIDYDEALLANESATQVDFSEGLGTVQFDYDENESSGSRLVCLDGKVNAKAFHLGRFPLRIGRDASNEVVVDDFNVSRNHAELELREDGKIYIVDRESTNGVKVNGALVTEHPLASHDVIQVGDALFEFLAPGVLSKGTPFAQVIQEGEGTGTSFEGTSFVEEGEKRKSRRFVFFATIAFLVLGVGFYIYSKRGSIGESVKNAAYEALALQVNKEVVEFQKELEGDLKKSVKEMYAEEVKEAFLKRVEQSNAAKLVPQSIKAKLQEIPAEITKLFVEDSSLLADIVLNQDNPRAVSGVLQKKITGLVAEERYQEALMIADYLIEQDPKNEDLKGLAEVLRKRLGDRGVDLVETPAPAPNEEQPKSEAKAKGSDGYEGSQAQVDDRKKLTEFMTSYKEVFNRYIKQKRADQAISYGKIVQSKLEELAANEPKFAELVATDLENWTTMVLETEKKYAELKAQEKKIWEKRKKGDQLLESIKMYADLGEGGKAREAMEKFLHDFRDHPSFATVQQMKKDQEKTIRASISTARTTVEDYLKTESYSNAWKEVYKFLDIMPFDPEIRELKDSVQKTAGGHAVQYYNQARVFEYETDDLVAAEQYYKRALEAADPRSELSAKANRRYEEVKRKSLR